MGTVSKWSQARVTGVTEEIELYKTKRHLFRLINALSASDNAPDDSEDQLELWPGTGWQSGRLGRWMLIGPPKL